MSTRRSEVADVFSEYGAAYARSHSPPALQRQVLEDLVACRTAALGGHSLRCDRCGHEEISYNSCRNRHCPKCQASARAQWLEKRRRDLLPVPYFHVVFTLPEELGPLALQNKAKLYGLLFKAAAQTLVTIAADPKHLGAQIGFLAVLHTWGQTLHHHPHVHCVVPAGGISPDGTRWVACRDGFFLPVRVLARLFRGKYLAVLDKLWSRDELRLCGSLETPHEREAWKKLLKGLYDKDWVVYAKPPFGGPEQVLKYLARYTHRVAISNQRLVSVAEGKVSFRWKDYANGNAKRTMTLTALEFIRRFLLHVLPKGFVRIRYFGFLANCVRKERIEHARKLISLELSESELPTAPVPDVSSLLEEHEDRFGSRLCPACGQGKLVVIAELPPTPQRPSAARARAPP